MDSRRPSSEASRVTLTLPKTIVDVLEPQFNSQKGNIVQATLTLAPQKTINGSPKRALVKQNILELNKTPSKKLELTGRNRYIVQNNQISEIQLPPNNIFSSCPIQQGQQMSRYSASTLLDINTSRSNCNITQVEKSRADVTQMRNHNDQRQQITNGVSTLPARHSKSLDQLKVSQMNNAQTMPKEIKTSSNTPVNYPKPYMLPHQGKPTTLPRSMTTTAYPTSTTTRCSNKGEDYRRNINEFREKYKNPGNLNSRCINNEVFHNSGHNYDSMIKGNQNQMYGYTFGNQGNMQVNSTVRNPLEFQRGYNVNLPRPMLPPRNSYPPVSGKSQAIDQHSLISNKHVHRSNSTHVFNNSVDNQEIDIEAARNQLRHELNYYLQKGDWSYDFHTGSLIQNYQKKSSKSSDDSGFVMTLDRSSDGTSKSTYSKTPPSTPHSTIPSIRHKKSRSRESKLNQSTKDGSKVNSSRDSLSSHHSVRSRDSRSDRHTPKSDRSTPKSDRGVSKSGKSTPKSGAITPRSGLATPKSGRATPKSDITTPKKLNKSEKRSKHKPSEKMTQLMSEAASSSSNESIPFELRRLGSSASVPYSLDQGPEILRNCRSAASVLDEPNLNNIFGSESLPNLAPPPAFESPPLDIADKDFQILPPDIFKNKEQKRSRSNSTSSLSEQSGWVSSGRSSGPSSPDNASSQLNQNTPPLIKPIATKPPVQKYKKEGDTINDFKRTILNGDQLRERLLKLAVKVAQNNPSEKIECCDKTVCEECTICSDSICTDSQCEYNKIMHDSNLDTGCNSDTCTANCFQQCPENSTISQRHNSFSAIQNKPYNTINSPNETSVRKSQTISDNLHPYIRKEISPKSQQIPLKSNTLDKSKLKDRIEYTEKLLAAELRSLTVDRTCKSHNIKRLVGPIAAIQKYHNKAKSEVDLSSFSGENDYEHLKLPPPQQFRDAPPPPDEFKVHTYKTLYNNILKDTV